MFPTRPGIRSMLWFVEEDFVDPSVLLVRSKFRDKYGRLWASSTPISEDLVEQAGTENMRDILLMVWREFRRSIDTRFNDPFLFWPRFVPGESRWTT